MTKNEVIDIVHNTILGFFDLAADDSEEPISEKDKLLLEVNKAVCNAIKEMPDDECRWIPVTERLPENSGFYLVTKRIYHEKKIAIEWFYEKNSWSTGWKVTAWMPLPKPYERSETDAEQL